MIEKIVKKIEKERVKKEIEIHHHHLHHLRHLARHKDPDHATRERKRRINRNKSNKNLQLTYLSRCLKQIQ